MNQKESEAKINLLINGFIEKFSIDSKPIEVSFKDLLPEIKKNDRFTHQIHSYPAKLLVHIPYFFLNNTIFSKKSDIVLDPFCGTGTVLLEGAIAKRKVIGADANPLAQLVSEVKTYKYNTNELELTLKKIIHSAKKYKKFTTPDVVNMEYWFSENTIIELSKIFTAIDKIEDLRTKQFMLVSFSNCVKKVSFADPRVSVPVKLNSNRYKARSTKKRDTKDRIKSLEFINVFEKFKTITEDNIRRFKELEKLKGLKKSKKVISNDARNLTISINSKKLLNENSVQLVITSPPYASAQKYIRASSLNLGWTSLANTEELLLLDKQNIGRENFRNSEIKIKKTGIKKLDELIKEISLSNLSRANIVCRYIIEMQEAFNEINRVLKQNGYFVLIVGNNKVCGKEFNTQDYFTEYLTNKGFKLMFKLIDDIKSYGLMTKRNKTADIITREWILVFKKCKNG